MFLSPRGWDSLPLGSLLRKRLWSDGPARRLGKLMRRVGSVGQKSSVEGADGHFHDCLMAGTENIPTERNKSGMMTSVVLYRILWQNRTAFDKYSMGSNISRRRWD